MEANPALILATYFRGLNAFPTSGGSPYPAFIDSLPDMPDNAASFVNTAGTTEGRIMRTGETVEKYGIQIRIRNTKNPDSYQKMRAIELACDAIFRNEVVVGAEDFLLVAVRRSSGILFLGLDDRKRPEYTLNVLATITAV